MTILPPQTPETFLLDLRVALATNRPSEVERRFANPTDARYLIEMVTERKPFHKCLDRFAVDLFPSPPGWERTGPYWVQFHHRQAIESDHDPVYAVVEKPEGLRLGAELPEWDEGDNRVRSARTDVHLLPGEHRVEIVSDLTLDGKGQARADVLRLGDPYTVSRLTLDGTARSVIAVESGGVPQPKEGEVLRVGSLLIPWSRRHATRVSLAYEGILPFGPDAGGENDLLDDRAGYLTAWWVPSTARLPFVSETRITGPKDWTLRSEGIAIEPPSTAIFPPDGGERRVAFRCDVPISFPKVLGGRYTPALSLSTGGRRFTAYGFAPLDEARLNRAVSSSAGAVAFYERLLGPFPFPSYEVFDADRFYGIESYSHTILDPKISDWAVSHEIGHTYFGGLVPCAYVRDSWNESLTEYVDSVLYKHDSDKTLERAFLSLNVPVPLSKMAVPWAYDSASYMRGAFVMAMLSHEIGQGAVDAGMRALVADRRGKDTAWPDLRPYFERAARTKLLWFWDQWVTGATFPRLDLLSAAYVGGHVRLTVAQSGTPKPFRLRSVVHLVGEGKSRDEKVVLDGLTKTLDLAVGFRPAEASLNVLGYAYVKAGPKLRLLWPQRG